MTRTILETVPAYADALGASGLTDFDAFMSVRGGPPVSRHKHRETIPLDLTVNGETISLFLKRDFKVAPKHAFWPLFRKRPVYSQPAHEWRMCRELARAGLPAMTAVAYGERRRFGMPAQAFVLVEAVPMRFTLENWLVPGIPKPDLISPSLIKRLFYEVGFLVGRLHQAGFDWLDLSAKHIYAAPKEVDCGSRAFKWNFRLIDLERIRQARPIFTDNDRLALPALPRGLEVLLCRLLESLSPLPVKIGNFWRLWSGLCHGAGLYSKPRGTAGRMRYSLSPQALIGFGLLPRPRLPDDYEHPRATPMHKRGRMFVKDRMTPALRSAGIQDFDDVFRYEGEQLWKPGLDSYRNRIRMVISNGRGHTNKFYLKRYLHPPLKAQLQRIRECGSKKSTGWREIHFAKHLLRLGIPTMRGVAYGQEMNGFWEVKSFGITEEIQGSSLETVINEAVADDGCIPGWEDRKEIIRQLGLITGHLHRRRFFHRDLYLCHVFLSRNKDGGIVLRLIDLARMITNPRRPERWIIKDLAALDYSAQSPLVTRADRLRFLYHYDPRLTQLPKRAKMLDWLTEKVRKRTRRMARHDAKRAQRGEAT
ncbi:MAG: hypothetical protein MI923_16850 [Phycisphaerales bacterium]|nr:hypothetical protein [Phycisphaerales bacterium]